MMRSALSHACCFDSGRCGCVCCHCVFKLLCALCGVSMPRHWQSCVVSFASWASRRVIKPFKVYFADVDIAGSSVVAVIGFGWSGFSHGQSWNDLPLLGQICRNIARIRLPRCSTDTPQQSVVVSLLFWNSSHGLDNIQWSRKVLPS